MLALSGHDSQSRSGVQSNVYSISGKASPTTLNGHSWVLSAIGTSHEDQAWSHFRDTNDVTLQNALFEFYQHIPKKKADWYIHRLPYSPLVEPDDVRNDAACGLLEAIRKYKLGFNTVFSTYANTIVNGRIIDGIRELQNFTRQCARVRREVAPLLEKLWFELERWPTQEDLLKHFPDFKVGGFFGIKLSALLPDPLITASVFNQSLYSGDKTNDQPDQDDPWKRNFEETLLERSDKETLPATCLQQSDLWVKILKYLAPHKDVGSVMYRYYRMGYTSEEVARSFQPRRSATWVSAKKVEGLKLLRKAMRADEIFEADLLTGVGTPT